jgi:hypothetical protein
MGNSNNNKNYLSDSSLSTIEKNYLYSVKKGMRILYKQLDNNQNNINRALERKYFDKIITIRQVQTNNVKKVKHISWKKFMIHYFTSKVNEESFYSDIIKNIEKEIFLSENKYISNAFFKEFEIMTKPQIFEKLDKKYKFNDNEKESENELLEKDLKRITYNENIKETNFSTSRINLTNITLNLGGSFNNNNYSQSINSDDPAFEYALIRNRVKEIIKIFKTHIKNKDHPINIVICIFEKFFSKFLNDKKKKMTNSNYIGIENFNKYIIEEIHKFILKTQSALKLMYAQVFNLQCLSEEKDETINLITNCLFETGNLYDEIYNLYQIELAKNIEDYSKKIKVLENINPQNLNIPDKFCLNNLTEEYKNNLKKNNNNEFTLSGINNTDNKERNEILNEINTNKRTSVIEEIEIKKEGYKSAINLLKGLKHKKTPFEKMMIIATISTEIIKCVNNYWKGMEHYISSTLLNITADELMAIFIFIVIKSQISDLLIHKKIIFDFTTKNIKQSTIGYYNITLEGAVEYILNCAIQELGFEEELKHIIEDNKSVNNLPFSIEN